MHAIKMLDERKWNGHDSIQVQLYMGNRSQHSWNGIKYGVLYIPINNLKLELSLQTHKVVQLLWCGGGGDKYIWAITYNYEISYQNVSIF